VYRFPGVARHPQHSAVIADSSQNCRIAPRFGATANLCDQCLLGHHPADKYIGRQPRTGSATSMGLPVSIDSDPPSPM
ncbi:MAG: hypothetical protein WBX10_13250, partial [Candidatus Sulfotelmatobacter sp.]